MKKFWILVRNDDGMQTYENYEPVLALSKSEVEGKILEASDRIRCQFKEYNSARMRLSKATSNRASQKELEEAQKAFLKASNRSGSHVDINGYRSTEVVDSSGSIAEDFEILTDDEFFEYKATRTPQYDLDGKPMRFAEVTVQPLVGNDHMDCDDLTEGGKLNVPLRTLIVISGCEIDVSSYGLQDFALDTFHGGVAIACLDHFSIECKIVPFAKPEGAYDTILEVPHTHTALPKPGA